MAINIFTSKILNDEQIEILGDGEQKRDFTYVEDIVQGTYLAGIKEFDFVIFNVSTGNTITVNNLIKLLGKTIDAEPNLVYSEKAAGDVRNTEADVSKAKKKFGYKPEFDIESGIKLYVDWYKKEIGFDI